MDILRLIQNVRYMKLRINGLDLDVKYLGVQVGYCLDYEQFTLGDEDYEDLFSLLEVYPDLGDEVNGLYLKIDIDSGEVINWPKGKPSDMHCKKVGDNGIYSFIDESGLYELYRYAGYVPECFGDSYGDYFEFDIDSNGFIEGWKFTQDDMNKLMKNNRLNGEEE